MKAFDATLLAQRLFPWVRQPQGVKAYRLKLVLLNVWMPILCTMRQLVCPILTRASHSTYVASDLWLHPVTNKNVTPQWTIRLGDGNAAQQMQLSLQDLVHEWRNLGACQNSSVRDP